jgi:hypothetical protein
MQLLAIALYSRDGRRRDVEFEPGKLNIVTGESKTGKSALLTITEYCLGRKEYLVPAGPIETAVSWYAILWQMGDDPNGDRAVTARPAPPEGQKTTTRMMLAFGGRDLGLPAFADLKDNSDTDSVRRLLGRRIGIDENVVESRGPGMNQAPFEAHIGHAAWLCFQDQHEVASKTHLFHRQGEGPVAEHLKDTIPYFLGAVPADAAAQRAALRDAQRAVRRAESALANAEKDAYDMDAMLRGLLTEARAAGLTEVTEAADRSALLSALFAAVGAPTPEGTLELRPSGDGPVNEPGDSASGAVLGSVLGSGPEESRGPVLGDGERLSEETEALLEVQNRRRALLVDRDRLSAELNDIMDSRKVLLDRRDQSREFAGAVEVHAGRLTSLNLLSTATSATPAAPATQISPTAERGDGGERPHELDANVAHEDGHEEVHEDGARAEHEGSCPVCGHDLPVPDPSVDELRERLTELRAQVADLGRPPGSIEGAISSLETAADRVRAELAATNAALEAVAGAEQLARRERNRAAAAYYTRGRISAYLSVAGATAAPTLNRLRSNVAEAHARLDRLAEAFDPDTAREQLHSRLNIIGRSLTDYARRLGVEHVQDSVRLDLANLTVVTDTARGPLPLVRIGSGSNWIGLHLATHLALHRFLVNNDRPVPRFLMVDQPTQAFFPSEAAKASGEVVKDSDRDTVLTMFATMKSLVDEVAPKFQIIVSDHADLKVDWFQEAIQHTWRDGVKLVPLDWLDDDGDDLELAPPAAGA